MEEKKLVNLMNHVTEHVTETMMNEIISAHPEIRKALEKKVVTEMMRAINSYDASKATKALLDDIISTSADCINIRLDEDEIEETVLKQLSRSIAEDMKNVSFNIKNIPRKDKAKKGKAK